MTTKTQSQTPPKSSGTGTEALSQTMKSFCTQLKSLTTSAGFESVLSLVDEVKTLKKELEQKGMQLDKYKEEMEVKEKNKQVLVCEFAQYNEKEVRKHEGMQERLNSIQKALDEKKKHCAQKDKLVEELKKQNDDCQQSYLEEHRKVNIANGDIDKLQKNIKEKDKTIDTMKKDHAELETRLSESKKAAKQTETNTFLKQSLEENQKQLHKIEGLAIQHHQEDEDQMVQKFNGLWENATQKIRSHMQKDLPDQALQNLQAWESFKRRSDQVLRHHIPLPLSNSKAAKEMRLVIILALIARDINKHIFQSTYIFPEDNQVREMLANLATTESEKESFCRAILLSVEPDKQKARRDEQIQVIVRNISSYLVGLLLENQFNEFCHDLQMILEKSIEVWEPLQRSQQRYEPDFEPHKWGDYEGIPFLFPGKEKGADPNMDSGILDGNLLTVFPRISSIDHHGRVPHSYVIQVTRSSQRCMSAEQELAQQSTSSMGRAVLSRSRRKSIASQPTTEQKPRGSEKKKSTK